MSKEPEDKARETAAEVMARRIARRVDMGASILDDCLAKVIPIARRVNEENTLDVTPERVVDFLTKSTLALFDYATRRIEPSRLEDAVAFHQMMEGNRRRGLNTASRFPFMGFGAYASGFGAPFMEPRKREPCQHEALKALNHLYSITFASISQVDADEAIQAFVRPTVAGESEPTDGENPPELIRCPDCFTLIEMEAIKDGSIHDMEGS